MSTHLRDNQTRTRSSDAPPSVRWRLWAAMLALALVPTASGIYLTMSVLNPSEPAIGTERARETSQSAASLLAREQGIEARLLVAAADPAMADLANGLNGSADLALAERVLNGIRGADADAIGSACIVRSRDGRSFPLAGSQQTAASACADDTLRRRAIGATTDTVTRAPGSTDAAGRLMLATPLRSVTGRNSGVLSIELDVASLFDRAHLPGDAVSSMLVDMGSSEVVAASAATSGPVESDTLGLAALAPYVEGIVAESQETDRRLATMGLASTIVPLWSNGDGSNMGLLQVWPRVPAQMSLEMRLAFLALIAGAIVAVIVLVRYFLRPFEQMADSRAAMQELYHEAREDAMADGLTGLGNHRAFQESLSQLVADFEERGTPFSLLLMDLDDLKAVNDADGHAAGDDMLRSMARTMRELARHGDMLYRTGGDEFAMLLPNSDILDATAVAERVLHFSKRPDGGRPCPFSGGISGVPFFTRQRETVYRQADAALYWAKRHGRGTIEVFEADRDQTPEEYDEVSSNAVAEVIMDRLLRPVFQPIVDLRSGRILGFEGLVRPDPNGPLPDASRLFAAAAAAGRTVELDLACIEVLVQSARAIGPDRLLTLNISPRTLEVKDFDAAWLLKGLVRNGISPSRVILEMTEREEVDDLVRLRRTFASLQQYGLRLAADDVGAGNAGLRLLSQVQFDIVKIDLSLVQDGVRQMGSRAVLQSLRDLALSQDSRIVAEGVETAEQLHVIRDLDIGAGQGYLLGRPDASVAQTFVDVRQLESGVLLPAAVPAVLTTMRPTVERPPQPADDEGLSPERRAIFLPPARGGLFEAKPGPA